MNILKDDKVSETALTSSAHIAYEIEAEEIEVNSELKVAEDFTLTTLQGEQVTLSDYKGKIVILNFWVTWCEPCKEEMPYLQSFAEEHPDVAVLAVNLTSMDLGMDIVKQFVDVFGLTFPILLDEADVVGKKYNIITIQQAILSIRKAGFFERWLDRWMK